MALFQHPNSRRVTKVDARTGVDSKFEDPAEAIANEIAASLHSAEDHQRKDVVSRSVDQVIAQHSASICNLSKLEKQKLDEIKKDFRRALGLPEDAPLIITQFNDADTEQPMAYNVASRAVTDPNEGYIVMMRAGRNELYRFKLNLSGASEKMAFPIRRGH